MYTETQVVWRTLDEVRTADRRGETLPPDEQRRVWAADAELMQYQLNGIRESYPLHEGRTTRVLQKRIAELHALLYSDCGIDLESLLDAAEADEAEGL